MHLKIIPTVCLALLIGGASTAVASPDSSQGGVRRTFEQPSYVHQPLPYTLQTATDWQTVGMNALIAQDYVNSLEAFDKAVDLSAGKNAEILEQRGWIHYLQSDYEQAIADLNRAATLYQDQAQPADHRNARRMRLFIEAQAERFDSAS